VEAKRKKMKIISFSTDRRAEKIQTNMYWKAIGKIQLCLAFYDRESMFNLFLFSPSIARRGKKK
jgi:hypothetical protein